MGISEFRSIQKRNFGMPIFFFGVVLRATLILFFGNKVLNKFKWTVVTDFILLVLSIEIHYQLVVHHLMFYVFQSACNLIVVTIKMHLLLHFN